MIHKILNTNKVLLKDRGEKIAYLGVVRGFDDLDSALKQLNKNEYVKDIEVIGKFINFDLKWEKILKDFDLKTQEKKNKKIILEHTSVNPNAPPHVGRTRNAIIGSTLEKVFKYNGYDVEVQYYVNDIGKQVAILVYGVKDKNLDELTPEDLLKIYIETNKNLDEEVEKEVIELLEKFESGDERTKELFRKVVEKALKLQINIFGKLNVKYDKFIYESDFLCCKQTTTSCCSYWKRRIRKIYFGKISC
jgi:arginyl-tRNA synthetase